MQIHDATYRRRIEEKESDKYFEDDETKNAQYS